MRAPLPPCCYDDMLAYLSSSSSSLLIFLLIINDERLILLIIIITYYFYFIILLLLLFFWSPAIVHVSILFSMWQSTPLACSPPSSSIAFSTILESQEQENTNLNRHVRRLYCHNLHSTKSYKPMWVLDGVPVIALMQLRLTYLFDLFRFYTITTTLTVSNAHKKPQAKRTLVC